MLSCIRAEWPGVNWAPSFRLFGKRRDSGSSQAGKQDRPQCGRAIRTAQPDNTRRIALFAMAGHFARWRRPGAVFPPNDSVEPPAG